MKKCEFIVSPNCDEHDDIECTNEATCTVYMGEGCTVDACRPCAEISVADEPEWFKIIGLGEESP